MALRSPNVNASPWLIPLLYALGAIILGYSVPRIANDLQPHLVTTITVNVAVGIYSAIASGMIALTGIVFSLTFVMVQFSATAYSPRLVLWIARDPVISHSIGVFTATFLYSLAALAWVDRGGSGKVPLAGAVIVDVLLIASVIMFVSLIQRIGLLQVNRMLVFTGDQGRKTIETFYLPLGASGSLTATGLAELGCIQTFLYHGPPRIVQTLDIPYLVELSNKAGCVIESVTSVGDSVFDGIAIFRVLGAITTIPERKLRAAIQLGGERTFEQDPKYAIRLLVDIAIRALSPAVNDPTTAVQALDQIEDLLIRLGRRRLEIGSFCDADGNLRLVTAVPSWEDFLRLSFDEIRLYGATSIQVMRRMKALVTELISVLPEARRSAVRIWQERLRSSVERSFADQYDKSDASTEDRQGLGVARRPM